MDFLIDVANAVLEASGLKEKVARSEQVVRIKQRFGLDDIESLTKFEDVYAYALVEYAFDAEGRCKPDVLIAFFKEKAVRDVFKVAFRENDPADWLGKGQAIAQYQLGDKLPGLDPKRELSTFAAAFVGVLNETRSPKEVRQEQKIDSLQRQLQRVQSQIQQLPSLEAINQTVSRLAGREVRSLPAAAQESSAADLAYRLGEWFDVLEYERVADYEVWAQDYFEWAIDFPVTRRRVSRTLVRGVAGEVDMADLQAFARAIEAAGADEGWLVGNRRVSQAARRAAQGEESYEQISCYTFDELIDEDADFSRYLDWLEADIKQRGVDVGYLPLACRKDELDPVSQRKIGVSTYAEEDGWIDGYVDVWLDDPAKEHLSVLGEFGTGKTWFALHYAWVALQRYRDAKRRGIERPRVPIVVPLRDYAKAVSVESLFSEFFFRKHEILKNYSVFEQLNRMGKLLLIFDGFDEMAARVDHQAMIDNFWELAKVVVPGAKAILTCRTEHFPDAIQGRQLLSAELESSTANLTGETPQFEVLDLEKFDDKQIATLLGQKASISTVRVVMENLQLLDLARRPVMVELILEALPDIEAGKPVDMARVYLYAVTKKMQRDISNERTFTSLADKLYFLCELSWEMLSTNQMSLNYRAFPEQLKEMFKDRVKDGKELDHWRYDMMGQTMLVRNSEGDYSPAHRSLLEFFVAYKIVASLGAMAEDFTAVAREQSYLNKDFPSRSYTWESYFERACNEQGEPDVIAELDRFEGTEIDSLLPLLGQAKLAKAVLDLAHPMLDGKNMRERLLPFLQATAQRTLTEIGYLGGNIAQLMLARTPHALMDTDLGGTKLQGIDFTRTFLRRVNLQEAQLADAPFSKVLGNIYSVDYSPDGNHLAVGDSRGVLQVLDIFSGQVILFFSGHSAAINSLSYVLDSQQIVSGGDDGIAKLWDLSTGECILSFEGHQGGISSVAYSSTKQQLALGSFDNTVQVWEPISRKCLFVLADHENAVLSVAYKLDGQQLATGSDDNTVKLWNTMTGECIRTLESNQNGISSLAYSPSGQLLATGSNDKTIKIWSIQTGECARTLEGHKSGVNSVAYSPNGKLLATGSDDRTIKIWSIQTGECVHTLEGHKSGVNSVAYSLDGLQIASGSYGAVRLWNPRTTECIRTFEGHKTFMTSAVYSNDGFQLASGSADSTVKLWNSLTGTCTRTFEGHTGIVISVAYSPEGSQLASGSADSTVKLWDTGTGECTCTLKGHEDWVWPVAYSPDGSQLASGSEDKTVRLWDLHREKCRYILKGHENLVRSLTYSPDGSLLASGSDDAIVKLWDLKTGKCVLTLEGHESGVTSVAYSPDGSQLASGSDDKTVKLWDSRTGRCVSTIENLNHEVIAVAYRPDGTQLAFGNADNTVKLWDLQSEDYVHILNGHDKWIRSVTYAPDGLQLASASDDDTIRIWDVETGDCIRVIDDRVCTGLDITGTIGLSAGQRTVLKLMGAVDRGEE